ncbi:multifunctional CCA protein [Geomonas silvestris]|uniref:Multifunctional CCA protein n=1 Tax=Geomonas silvestris TaxID=2740184 RepID=A0A6V8MLY5_9BACT|nr:HD domain-containing protein [Geomonas silvestris]GFO61055.1 multifunctional CCA protein [Geomonas silvestris]
MDSVIHKLKTLFPEQLHDHLFLVGGMVRDVLLGIPSQDVDLAAAVPTEALTALGFRLVESKSTPNIYFRYLHDLGKVEITWLPSLAALDEDLVKRDFCANAMAMTLDGRLYDPLKGRPNLEGRVLRTCSATSLTDDPIRIFRALRFECEGWRLDAAAEGAVLGRDWEPGLEPIPIERFSQEMLKALAKPDPSRFFRRMVELRVGRILLPEIFEMASVPAGPVEHHPEGDLFTHSLQTLERMAALSADPAARFCALFHDLGKLATAPDLYPKHHGHDRAGAELALPFCRRLRLPVVLQRALQSVCKLHNTANRWQELRDSTKIQLALDAMKGGTTEILPLVVRADFAEELTGWERVLEVAALNSAQLGIDPKEFAGEPEKLQQVIMQRRVERLRLG